MKKITALFLPLALAGACTSDQAAKKPTTTAAVTAPAPKQEAPKASTPTSTVAIANAPDKPLYFDFDSESLRPESQEMLKQLADYLKKNPAAQVTISGHADDTGTSEYNMALGDKRARAAREYLEALGIEPQRVQSISFGEEKPAVDGVDDSARSKNRRDEIDVVKKDAQSAAR
jgi:peptidoglycan-associated lipoprotein